MDTAIVVFTRDLRLHDNPALHQAYVRARPAATGWSANAPGTGSS